MRSIGVFCGSSPGDRPEFLEVARQLGKVLAERKITLVYGGANIGLMGAVADAALEGGGSVIGVIPRFLQSKEVAHANLTQLILCDTMHERKQKMFELSQGFIALPGGFGTLEEVMEMLTWRQLGLHERPIGFLNIAEFYDHLEGLFDEMALRGFLKSDNRKMALFEPDLQVLLSKMSRATVF